MASLPIQNVSTDEMEDIVRKAQANGGLTPQGTVGNSSQLALLFSQVAQAHNAPTIDPNYYTQVIEDNKQFQFTPGQGGTPDWAGATIADHALETVRMAALGQNLANLPESVLQSIALQGLASGWINLTGQAVGDTLGNMIGQHAPQGQEADAGFLVNYANNPDEYSWNKSKYPYNTAQQMATEVEQIAGQKMVNLNPAQVQEIATKAYTHKLQPGDIDKLISGMVYDTAAQPAMAAPAAGHLGITPPSGTPAGTNAPGLQLQLQQQAGAYLQKLGPAALQNWERQLVSGTQTSDAFTAHMANEFQTMYPGMYKRYADQINAGVTPTTLANNLTQLASSTLEVDPSQVDYLDNPLYRKMLDGGPNGDMMTYSQATDYLRSQPQFWKTNGARDQMASVVTRLLSDFGQNPIG